MDVEPSTAHRTAEVNSTRKMIDRVEMQFNLKPQRLLGDTAYGSAAMLEWLVEEKHIEPHIPVWEKTNKNQDIFNRTEFIWDGVADKYTCPAGKPLQSRWRNFSNTRSVVTKADTIIYRSSKKDCDHCSLKSQCCPNTPIRKIPRSIYEASRDVTRAINQTPEYQQSRNDRKKVEVLFAHLKRILKLDRLRLRGPTGASDEFLMAATVQNLRKLAKLKYEPPDCGILAPT